MQQLQETWIWSLGQEDSLEEGMATHSSIFAWRILWTEEPGGLWSMGSQRVRHDWIDLALSPPQFFLPRLPSLRNLFWFQYWSELWPLSRDAALWPDSQKGEPASSNSALGSSPVPPKRSCQEKAHMDECSTQWRCHTVPRHSNRALRMRMLLASGSSHPAHH